MDEDIGDEGNSKRLQQSLLKAKVYIKPVYKAVLLPEAIRPSVNWGCYGLLSF